MYGSYLSRVLFVATLYDHLLSFHLPHMRLLLQLGCEVHAAANINRPLQELQGMGVVCWDIPFSRSPYSRCTLKSYRELRDLFTHQKYDLVHVHTPVASFITRCVARRTGQKSLLYTAHGFHFYRGAPIQNWLLYYPAEKWAARRTDALITLNEEDFKSGQMLGFVPGENLFWVHGVGVDLDPHVEGGSPIRTELGLSMHDLMIVCVGELNHNKNHASLLSAWRQFSLENANAYLILVGDGILRPELEASVMRRSIPRVQFLGYRHDVPQILHEADIFVLCSKREGLPRAVMEAMVAGLPVLATDVRGTRELVRNGSTGILVNPKDRGQIVSGLQRLAENPGLRSRMGSLGKERISDYSTDAVLEEMMHIYSKYLPIWAHRPGSTPLVSMHKWLFTEDRACHDETSGR